MREQGKARYGANGETFFLCLSGGVSYMMAPALEELIGSVLLPATPAIVFIDLRAASHLDSTALGLLARIGDYMIKRGGRRAVIACCQGDVETSLRAVGFDQVFEMVTELPEEPSCELQEIPTKSEVDQRTMGEVVLSAHHNLMAVSQENQQVFRDVVAALERELATEKKNGDGPGT